MSQTGCGEGCGVRLLRLLMPALTKRHTNNTNKADTTVLIIVFGDFLRPPEELYVDKKKRGPTMPRRDLKVVGNRLDRCNNSSPRGMRENHYAYLCPIFRISYVLKSQD